MDEYDVYSDFTGNAPMLAGKAIFINWLSRCQVVNFGKQSMTLMHPSTSLNNKL